MLVLVTVVAILSWWWVSVGRQKKIVSSLKSEYGVKVIYDFEEYNRRQLRKDRPDSLEQLGIEVPGKPFSAYLPKSLCERLGKDFCCRVSRVECQLRNEIAFEKTMELADQLGSVRSLKINVGQVPEIRLRPERLFRGLRSLNVSARRLDADSLANVRNCPALAISCFDLDIEQLRGSTDIQCFAYGGQGITTLAPLADNTQMKYLSLPRSKVVDLNPVSRMVDLQVLNVGCENCGIDALRDLKKLKDLRLNGGGFADISPVESMTKLQRLSLQTDQRISDLRPLSSLGDLELLSLSRVDADDYSALKKLVNLRRLYIRGCSIRDLGNIAPCSQLESIDLRDSAVEDLSPLAGLEYLEEVNLANCRVSELPPDGWPGIGKLNISGTNIASLAPLRKSHQLHGLSARNCRLESLDSIPADLDSLSLRGCVVKDFSGLAGLSKMRYLDLSESNFTDSGLLSSLVALTQLNLGGCPIDDLSPLSEMSELRSLDISGTPRKNLKTLPVLPELYELDVSGTGLTDFTSLGAFVHEGYALYIQVLIGDRVLTDEQDAALPENVSVSNERLEPDREDSWRDHIW